MLFPLSKIAWLFAEPTDLAALLLLAGVGLLWTRWSRWGRGLLSLLALATLVFATLPVGDWLLEPLEFRFPPPVLPERVDGILVLGGFLDPIESSRRDQPALTDAGTRLITFLALAKKFPEAKLVFSGGSGGLLRRDLTEAPVMRRLLDQVGFDASRPRYEDRSRNTYENAVFTKQLVDPQLGQNWLLVTSASNMPRAIGCFRAAGWGAIIPYPTDYVSPLGRWYRSFVPLSTFIAEASRALHEWVGLAVYRALGRTDEIFPGPTPSSDAEPHDARP